jgi:hypothetical protein
VLGNDERRRRERHQLPGTQESDGVARREHQLHRAQQQVERDSEEDRPPAKMRMADVSDAEERDRDRENGEDQKKPRR